MSNEEFKHISIGTDGSIWAAGKTDGTIFRLYGDAGFVGWVPDKAGKAEVIAAVDWGNAWCVNKEHEIWHLTNAESLDKGGTWTKVPTHSGRADAKTIAVGSDGSVWYAQTDGKTFHRPEPGDGAGLNVDWVEDKRMGEEKTAVMAVSAQDGVWCITHQGNIQLWQNGTWIKIATHSGRADAKTLSVNKQGRLWYTSTDGELFVAHIPGDGVSLSRWMHDTSWDQKQMGHAEVVSVSNEHEVYCLNSVGDIWRAVDGTWSQVKSGPVGNSWTYTVKQGDGLMAIVRQEFNLKDPQDTQEIGRLVDLIVAQNRIKDANRIKAGDVLTLHY